MVRLVKDSVLLSEGDQWHRQLLERGQGGRPGLSTLEQTWLCGVPYLPLLPFHGLFPMFLSITVLFPLMLSTPPPLSLLPIGLR